MEPNDRSPLLISSCLLLVISLLAKGISLLPGLSIIGHLVIALVIGMAVQSTPNLHKLVKGGSHFIANKFLRLGIILLGFKLNLEILAQNGIKTLGLAMVVIAFTMTIIYLLATKVFHIAHPLALLSASGCSICGAAAVLGISSTIDSKEEDEVISVAIVAILGTIFTMVLVLCREALGLGPEQYGAWAGLSLHEIAHAVAAGNAGGSEAVNMATIVKLSRVLMLAPLSMAVPFIFKKQSGPNQSIDLKRVIPWFMLGFLATSAIGTYGGLSDSFINRLVDLAYLILGMAMAALGANVNFEVILKRGQTMFLAATIGSICLSVLALGLAKWLF